MKLKYTLFFAAFLFSFGALFAKEVALTPLGPGEMIFEPFNEPNLTNLSEWKIINAKNSRLSANSTYGTYLSLLSLANDKKASATLTRSYSNFNCAGYDNITVLLKGLGLSEGIKLTLSVQTDKGNISVSKLCGKRQEIVGLILNLKKAKKIKKISFTLEAPVAKKGSWRCCLYYMALRNDMDYAAYQRYLKNLGNIDWDKFIKPINYQPKFEPQFGLFFKDKKELAEYRKYCKSTDRYQFLSTKAENFATFPVEKLFDKQLFIDAEAAKRRQLLGLSPGLQICQAAKMGVAAALITKNKAALRNAAKLAIVLATADFINEMGSMANMQGATLDRTAFIESKVLLTTAKILDFAGEMLTDTGRRYVLKCMAKKGIGAVNYSAWVYSFAYVSNQMAIFNNGRLAIYLIFEKLGYKHVIPYTDVAMNELNISMNNCFKNDGGNIESTGYMNSTLVSAIPSYSMYAQVRGKKLSEVLPKNLLKSDSWVNCIASTNKNASVIPIGQSSYWNLQPQVAAFMAAALQDTQWVRIFNKYPGKDGIKDVGYWFEEKFYAWKYAQEVKEKYPPLKTFVQTKSNGLVVSHRKLNEKILKLLVVGFADHVGKRHEDIGSFILEYAGDSFFIDPPYYIGYYGAARFHNVLTPGGKSKIMKPKKYTKLWRKKSTKKLIPVASGDKKKFSAKIDLRRAWERKYFKQNIRSIISPKPNVIEISDKYILGNDADYVEFNLQCILPVKINGRKIIISGKKASAIVTVPKNCTIKTEKYRLNSRLMEEMNLSSDDFITRIIVCKNAKQGLLKIKIELKLNP